MGRTENGCYTNMYVFESSEAVQVFFIVCLYIQFLNVLPNPLDKIINEITCSIYSYGVESQTKLKGKLLLVSMRRDDLKCHK